MADESLFASSRTGDLEHVCTLLAAGGDVDARDEHGWTALCWAAGAGHLPIIQALIERGADACVVAADGRTPSRIALAAGRTGAARLLLAIEASRTDATAGAGGVAIDERPYCRAYLLRDLRRWPAWPDADAADGETAGAGLSDETIVFVHRDRSVTRGIAAQGDGRLLDGTGAGWARFCTETLGFLPPDDFDETPPA